MGNYIATLIVLLGLLIIPTSFAQVHGMAQLKQELREIQADAVKKVEAEGAILPSTATTMINQFVSSEIASKNYRLDESLLTISVSRTAGISDNELTYKDEFVVTFTYKKPKLVSWFTDNRNIQLSMYGTMEPLPYDAN